MHFVHPPTFLPAGEYRRLQRLMLTMIGSRSALASILRRKLGSAESVPSSAVAHDVAVSGRRVRFRIDGRRLEDRILSWEPPARGKADQLSLHSPRGLALLGLSPGESVSYRTEAGRTEFIEVEQVSAAPSRRMPRIATSSPRDIIDVVSVPVIAPEGAVAGGHHV